MVPVLLDGVRHLQHHAAVSLEYRSLALHFNKCHIAGDLQNLHADPAPDFEHDVHQPAGDCIDAEFGCLPELVLHSSVRFGNQWLIEQLCLPLEQTEILLAEQQHYRGESVRPVLL